MGRPVDLMIGAGLFTASFVFDCVDGKLARLRGGGSFVGAWLDFMVDRIRFLLAASALFVGQYRHTGNTMILAVGVAVLLLDLMYYVNGAEVKKLSAAMQNQLAAAAEGLGPPATNSMTVLAEQTRMVRWFRSLAAILLRRRIRPRLFSGVEFEQAICVVTPLVGHVLIMSEVTVALDLVFEIAVIVLLFRSAGEVTRVLAGTAGWHDDGPTVLLDDDPVGGLPAVSRHVPREFETIQP